MGDCPQVRKESKTTEHLNISWIKYAEESLAEV